MYIRGSVAKRLLERDQHELRPDDELEELKQDLRNRARRWPSASVSSTGWSASSRFTNGASAGGSAPARRAQLVHAGQEPARRSRRRRGCRAGDSGAGRARADALAREAELGRRLDELARAEANASEFAARLEERTLQLETLQQDLDRRAPELEDRERSHTEELARLQHESSDLLGRQAEIEKLRAEITAEGDAVAARAAELESRLDEVERREQLASELDARTKAAEEADERHSAEGERLAELERTLGERARELDAREIAVAAFTDREEAFEAAQEEAAERERRSRSASGP